jgi:hypothetical protein
MRFDNLNTGLFLELTVELSPFHIPDRVTIQGVPKMLEQISGTSSPHRKEESSSYQYLSGNTFRGTVSMFSQFQTCRFLSVGALKIRTVSNSY